MTRVELARIALKEYRKFRYLPILELDAINKCTRYLEKVCNEHPTANFSQLPYVAKTYFISLNNCIYKNI